MSVRRPETGQLTYNVTVSPLCPPDPPPATPPWNLRILQGILFVVLGAVAGDVGVAAAGGVPVTAKDIWADIIGGAAGGTAGAIASIAGGDAGLVALVGAFVAGFVEQALFPPSPFPPHAVHKPAL